MVAANMAFLSSLLTRQILFYLTVVCNLATCSPTGPTLDDETNLVSGCRYTYPSYINPYTPLSHIDLISCRNMLTAELPFYENVTTMELVNVPLAVLNDTEIPNAVRQPRVGLRHLSWSKSHIRLVQSLPLERLLELDLSWNLIQEVRPTAFHRLEQLALLNVSHNQLESLPERLFPERNQLRTLSVAHNQLRSVPRDLSERLLRLETFDASHNQIRHLRDSAFRRLRHLRTLNLAHNRLSLVPADAFDALVALQYLSLEANQLFNVEPGAFDHQHQLLALDLGRNPLLSLPGPLLPANNSLLALTISHSNVTRLPPATLHNLRALRQLRLSDNRRLHNLANDSLAQARHLRLLHLHNNNFTQLPLSVLETELDDLRLDGNPWPCDCSVQWIVFWAYGAPSQHSLQDRDVRMSGSCNATDQDLVEALRRLRCRPSVLRVSPVRYEQLEATVKLVCRSYANPTPTISWLTPNGLAHLHAKDTAGGSDQEFAPPRLLHSALANRRHLPVDPETVADGSNSGGGNLRLYENGDLHIGQMSRDDAGEYMCVAANQLGESFAYTRLYVDPSIMQRIKTGSIICGFLWVNTFLLFSIVYLLIRRYSRRAKQEKRKRRMHENMDIYKSQQISRLRERCKNQMNRIKNNCSIQVEWMKDNYIESMNNSQDHRASYLTNQYNEQMAEIRDYYLAQMHKVREHFDQQRKLIAAFSVNRLSCGQPAPAQSPDDHQPPPAPNDLIVRMENGTASTMAAATGAADEDDLYRYNETMKSEIRRLTSLRNLHEALAIVTSTSGTAAAAAAKFAAAAPPSTTASGSGCSSPSNGSVTRQQSPPAATASPASSGSCSGSGVGGCSSSNSSSRYDLYAGDNGPAAVSNGKLPRTSEDEGDEKTSMLLHKAKATC